ncbi:MAG: sensor histidine kinase [Nitrospira sp.]|nr:sensor histidine kinase [Nitrospira sp.]MDH4242780.1 sensor histidine kinase [Nitrospira sp.]MDH4354423.1 sensor histidine kinase [Nitrospira sp.]MDH5317160.1 sensor histidine kinase [Nitrospira sp.]
MEETRVTVAKKRFEVLDGGLQTTSRLSISQSARPVKQSYGWAQLEPCAGELTAAYKATEQRLHMLLEDRTRIGRDLHDCVLQSLYAIGLGIEMNHKIRHINTKEPIASDIGMIEQINQLIHEVRSMIRELESGTIQVFDLASELNTLRTTYEQTGQLRLRLDLQQGALEVLTHEEEREILNIVREALSNCARHAHAYRATVAIRMKDTRIRVTVQDDGIGFSTVVGQSGGYGLANMEARAKKLGGTLRVQSKTGGGTQVTAEFSLEPLLTPV